MTKAEDKPEKSTAVCPLCGASGYTEEDLPNSVKEAFLIAMLGDFPYSGCYDIMDGRIRVTVSSPTEKGKRVKLKFVVKIGDMLAAFPNLQPYTIALDQYIDAALQITKIEINIPDMHVSETIQVDGMEVLKAVLEDTAERTTEKSWQEFVDSAYERIFNGICKGKTIPVALLMAAVVKHNTLANRLLKACLNENFIQGIGQ